MKLAKNFRPIRPIRLHEILKKKNPNVSLVVTIFAGATEYMNVLCRFGQFKIKKLDSFLVFYCEIHLNCESECPFQEGDR